MSKRNSQARRWFQQASYDLKAARWNAGGGFYDTACFLGQQSGEKALKALMHYYIAVQISTEIPILDGLNH